MNYRLAPKVEIVGRERGSFLVSQAPLRALRLNGALAALLGRNRDGMLSAASEAEARVLEQLAVKGFVERLLPPQGEEALPAVTVVIPVKDRAEELRRCLASLDRLDYPREKLEVIVVDDGSSDGTPRVAKESGAVLLFSGGTGRGPAAARNVGAAAARGEILAFIDSDCIASPEWLRELVPSFADPETVAVGGRVDGLCDSSAVDRYEAVMSSLSLGSRERSGKGGSDTFYLPSCNLLVRRSVFAAARGFDESMHVGEDVDLTWRLRDAGWRIAYLPAGGVLHEHRSTVRSFMSRRFDYGTSEGILQRLHPERRKRLVIPPLLGVVLALLVAAPFASGWLGLAAAGVLGGDLVLLRRRVVRRGMPISLPALIAGRLRALGSLFYYLCYHLVRYYAPVLLLAAVLVPPLWVVPAAALGCSAGVDYAVRRPRLPFPVFAGIYLLEQLAYGAGVFWGCLRRKSFGSYRVVVLRRMEFSNGNA